MKLKKDIEICEDIIYEFNDDYNISLHSTNPIIYIHHLVGSYSLQSYNIIMKSNVFQENSFYYKNEPSVEINIMGDYVLKIELLTIEEQIIKIRSEKLKKIL